MPTEDRGWPPSERRGQDDPKTPLYRIAFDAGVRAVDDQRDELNGIRTRAVAFSAIMATGTAFLVGSGLSAVPGDSRDDMYYAFAVGGTVLFAGMLAALSWILLPKHRFRFILEPGVLVTRWIDAEVPGPSEAQLLQALSEKTLPNMISSNERQLQRLRYAYFTAILCGGIGLLCWIGLVWARA